jgi:hypothetical protein
MRLVVHPRVRQKRPEIADADVASAFEHAIASQARLRVSPIRVIGAGPDRSGRMLEWAATPLLGQAGWLVFHATPATPRMLRELGLSNRRRE